MSETIFSTLSSFLAQAPMFLVWLAGLVVAIIRWQRHPRVSLLALIGLSLLLLETFIGTIMNIQLPVLFSGWGWGAAEIGTFFIIKGFIQAVVAAIGFGLLLVALFGWRTAPRSIPS